jgi:hypothetical protein
METEAKYLCWKCGHELDMSVKVQRRDSCPSCDADLHVCKNCRFWDPGHHNECRENVEHFVRDREKANFCMSFTFKSTTDADRHEADDARSRLEALFKKLK